MGFSRQPEPNSRRRSWRPPAAWPCGVAHEINNPLAGIKNAFRIFQRVIPKDCREYAYVAPLRLN